MLLLIHSWVMAEKKSNYKGIKRIKRLSNIG